ncbi:MAG: helix-turn-helix transcriptional regulator [Coriobacteriales bacterium]|jgi:DNA-binding HxlR family transcriptional regulator|nr:helix-turn-helix transcriptional regulator [Coriobacteriales bacterium]
MSEKPRLEKDMMCPLEFGLEKFGGRWKARIICALSIHDALRFGAIRDELRYITDSVLTAMLKELIADGLVSRKQFEAVPPRVEYSLTDKGRSVLPVLQSICQWSLDSSEEELERKLSSCQTCPQM